jgi:hypothetical protein
LLSGGYGSLRLWVLRDNPCRSFYEQWGGELLPQERQDELGGAVVTAVSYGWRDLEALGNALDRSLSSVGA